MSLESDVVINRLHLRKRLILWRLIAIFLFFCGIIMAATSFSLQKFRSGHISRLVISGVIGSDYQSTVDTLGKIAVDPTVKALILVIDSPGGAVTGGEMIHHAVAQVAAKKPVVVVMRSVAASAGYMIALPAHRIFAGATSITGSIGVLLQSPDISRLLDKIGVNVDMLVSGSMKGQPSVVHSLSADGREMLQSIVADLYKQFVDMVVFDRHMDRTKVQLLADGRPFTGLQALKLGLIDQIGSEQEAKEWLINNRALSSTLPVWKVEIGESGRKWWLNIIKWSLMGLVGPQNPQALNTVFLDGAVSIWNR